MAMYRSIVKVTRLKILAVAEAKKTNRILLLRYIGIKPFISCMWTTIEMGRSIPATTKSLHARFTKKYAKGDRSFPRGSFSTARQTNIFPVRAMKQRIADMMVVNSDNSYGGKTTYGAEKLLIVDSTL